MRDFIIAISLVAITFVIFNKSLNVFFVQDDFILLSEFTQNSLIVDLKNAISSPQVTHWRPVHNLYFLVFGNIFGRNFQPYHLVAIFIQALCGYLIYKIANDLFKDRMTSIIAALIYTTHSAHFSSVYWISGNSTSIGMMFFLSSFYTFLKKKRALSLFLFLISLLASEALLIGLVIFVVYVYVNKLFKLEKKFLFYLSLVSVLFFLVKLKMTPVETFETYRIGLGQLTYTIKYYALRVLGFGETSEDLYATIILTGLLLFLLYLALRTKQIKEFLSKNAFLVGIIFLGFFPFVLIGNHLSPHYMNLSIWGFASLAAAVLRFAKPKLQILFILLFLFVSTLNVYASTNNSWIIKRSNISKEYISELEKLNMENGSLVIFNDNYISSSYEAYISLGTGRALEFYFPDRNYRSCFTAFTNCQSEN